MATQNTQKVVTLGDLLENNKETIAVLKGKFDAKKKVTAILAGFALVALPYLVGYNMGNSAITKESCQGLYNNPMANFALAMAETGAQMSDTFFITKAGQVAGMKAKIKSCYNYGA
ncbi:hypothetical protein [Vibrio phage RYC]|nr:hypothetical protein [Vibrio phage RYC]